MSFIQKSKDFALFYHKDQKYGEKSFPYIYHLENVVLLLNEYNELIKTLGYLHDVLEDTDASFHDIEINFNHYIAECVSLLSDETGVDRQERKLKTNLKLSLVQPEFYPVLITKAADRLANMTFCYSNRTVKYMKRYSDEYLDFKKAAYRPNLCDSLWINLDLVYKEINYYLDNIT